MFAPNGEIFDVETVHRLMDIPEIQGMKHSSLDRLIELERLALRNAHRPDFRIYTGNDLGINMIEYGSDYLLGLAASPPKKFAERDRLWRPAILPTTHSPMPCSIWAMWPFASGAGVQTLCGGILHLTGRIPTERVHSRNPKRPPWEAEMLRDCARRLG